MNQHPKAIDDGRKAQWNQCFDVSALRLCYEHYVYLSVRLVDCEISTSKSGNRQMTG